MNEDFSLFFMIKRTKIHSNTDANKINSTGKIISCTDSSQTFCEYMNRTGNNESKKGWTILNFLLFFCNFIYHSLNIDH